MATLAKFLAALAILGVAVIALLAAFQTSLLFPRALVGPAPELPASTERLDLRRDGGDVLHGVRIRGRAPVRPVLLGFGGNAWNAEAMALFLHQIAPEHDVVTFHYRGYAPSTGRPSAQALMADAVAVHDLIAPDAPGVIAVGFSIGSGVAAHLAAERDIARVVLVTPFDSLMAVAQQLYPFAPVRLLFRHEMNAVDALSRSSADIRLILAARDEVIPPARAEALAQALPQAQVTRLETGHNAIYTHPDFVPALRAALAR
ncbi:MAG: alpha/beta fold hydrolase [Natronohydrobacter sp.]|nr:alpha/beta fold hydrolase [Natronohydrobacter sp.]